jgi:hypothetical protein
MADEAPPDEPLLVEDTHAVWDAIEDGSNRDLSVTVPQLVREDPDHVIAFLAKKGVAKLGDFKIQVCWGCCRVPEHMPAQHPHTCSCQAVCLLSTGYRTSSSRGA